MGLGARPDSGEAERPRIVLVDDDPIVCEIVAETLGAAGYAVATVHDGGDAMDAIWKAQPALVILDCGVPGRPGMMLLEDLRASAMFAEVPVIILTGRRSEWQETIALKNGANLYMRKPFDRRDLLVAVTKLLRPEAARSS